MKKLFARSRGLLVIVALAMVAAMCTASEAGAASSSPGAGSAASLNTAGSSAPCNLNHTIARCQSTDPTVTLSTEAFGNTSNCTFVWDISWGDGHSSTATLVDPADGWRVTAQHTYAAPGVYTVTATGTATAGCTLTPFIVTFTLASATPPTCPPAPQPQIYWSQTAGPSGVHFYFTGNGWYANNTVTIHLPAKGIFDVAKTSWRADSSGHWQLKITVAKSAPARTYKLAFTQTGCNGGLRVTGHFKVTMTHAQYATLTSTLYQIASAGNAIANIVGVKAWSNTLVSKAIGFIDKAQQVLSLGEVGLGEIKLGTDMKTFNQAMAKAHKNLKDPAVRKAARQVADDMLSLWKTAVGVVPGLDFILPPPVS